MYINDNLKESNSQVRAERTPEAVAVSGIYGRELAGGYSPAGIPVTNLKPFSQRDWLFVSQAGHVKLSIVSCGLVPLQSYAGVLRDASSA